MMQELRIYDVPRASYEVTKVFVCTSTNGEYQWRSKSASCGGAHRGRYTWCCSCWTSGVSNSAFPEVVASVPRHKSTVFVEETVVDSEVSRSLLSQECCIIFVYWLAMVLICRIREAKLSGDKVVDVDGSYLWRKYQWVSESDANVVPVGVPSPPLTGWQSVMEANHKEYADKIPQVTAGLLAKKNLSI